MGSTFDSDFQVNIFTNNRDIIKRSKFLHDADDDRAMKTADNARAMTIP